MMTTTYPSTGPWHAITSTDNRVVAVEPSAEMIEAAFASVLAEIESMPEDAAVSRRTASTCYVEALAAYRLGSVDSAAVALHCARFWATGRV